MSYNSLELWNFPQVMVMTQLENDTTACSYYDKCHNKHAPIHLLPPLQKHKTRHALFWQTYNCTEFSSPARNIELNFILVKNGSAMYNFNNIQNNKKNVWLFLIRVCYMLQNQLKLESSFYVLMYTRMMSNY